MQWGLAISVVQREIIKVHTKAMAVEVRGEKMDLREMWELKLLGLRVQIYTFVLAGYINHWLF